MAPGDDLDILLKYHHNMQEKIADNMLVLAHNMKEQSKLAGSIVRKDTEVIYTVCIVLPYFMYSSYLIKDSFCIYFSYSTISCISLYIVACSVSYMI